MTAAHHAHSCRARLVRRLGWISALALGLGACTTSIGPHHQQGWTEAGSPKELEVERAQYRHVVHFDTDQATIAGGERDRLLAFLHSVDLGPRDTLRLDGHADERASDLYNLDLAARRVQAVESFLRERGVEVAHVQRSSYGELDPRAPGSTAEAWRANRRVELVVERHVVVLPPCPDWSRQSGTDFANLPHSNYGCAVRTNLGLMVAEPRDLEHGRQLAPADGTHAAEAIVRYRTGKVYDLKQETQN